jgi:peptidoglycan/xylan/chitin deacetylase (PgdA/CDA1 family)
MLPVMLTVDTEYASGYVASGESASCPENFARCLSCETPSGAVGIHYQMEVLDRHGLKATFFVDPMPALVWGEEAVERVVGPIIDTGHDVQLHLHTEWLALADRSPIAPGRTGRNIADFTCQEQEALIGWAAQRLVAAGAAYPVAFRAGNYGANDDTLRALARLGIWFDSSFAPALVGGDCRIGLGREYLAPVSREGLCEVPIAAIGARGGLRHAQLTALSLAELKAAIRHASDHDWPAFVLVSHSFEMMNRDRGIANRVVQRRFEALCQWIAGEPRVTTGTFADPWVLERLEMAAHADRKAQPAPPAPLREMRRMAEQAFANAVYG